MNMSMKRTALSIVLQTISCSFLVLLLTTSCTNDETEQVEKQAENNISTNGIVFAGFSQSDTTTRTAIFDHTKNAGASVNWSNDDKIWVKDNTNNWQQSGQVTFPSTTNKSEGMFALSGAYTKASHSVVYTNKPISGTNIQVEIKAEQKQSAPNNFDHAGVSGDCGVAIAQKSSNGYRFTLNHKASYLCFIPRSHNSYVNKSKLIKIEIMSDNNIAGTYKMTENGTLTFASDGSKTITVTTEPGFDINDATENMNKNAVYAVVAPGTHSFRIRYWLRNTEDCPSGPIEGTVSKYVTLNCVAGAMNDITANLDPTDYDGDHYYMWDAKQQYWYGYEWTKKLTEGTGQTTTSLQNPATTFPVEGDQRYYNKTFKGFHISNSAIQDSTKNLPNVNEMTWYAMKGDPRWDNDELWSTMGHLYKGGMWFYKKDNIANYSKTKAYDNANYCNISKECTNNELETGLPSIAKAKQYFFLPALGNYLSGRLNAIAYYGFYWSSSGNPEDNGYGAYALYFNSTKAFIKIASRGYGYRVHKFE